MVSDLNHSLGRVESSDLVQNGRNYSPDVVGGLYWAQDQLISIISLWDVPQKHEFGLILASGGLFFDENQSLGRVKSSDLVQSGWNTSLGVVAALW